MLMKSRPDRSCTVFVRRGLVCTGLACLLLAHPCFAGDWDPPKPNPAKPVNYIEWINKKLAAGIEDNAAERYLKAYGRLTKFEGDWGDTLKRPWSEEENEAVAQWLKENRAALLVFQSATYKRQCFIPLGALQQLAMPDREPIARGPRFKHALINLMLPYLKPHRDAARGLVAKGMRDFAGGNERASMQNALAALQCAHHLGDRCATLIQFLVARACAQTAYAAMRSGLAHSEDPGKLATRTLLRIGSRDPPLPGIGRLMRFEQLQALDLAQRLFVPGPQSGQWTIAAGALAQSATESPAQSEREAAAIAAGLSSLGYDQTRRDLDAAYGAVLAWCAMPYPQAAPRRNALERRMSEDKNPLVAMLLPSLTAVRRTDEFGRAARRATHLIFHLHAHHGKTGQFPDTLAELDIANLDQLRIDPFSGRDLVYRKAGDSFTLYTVAGNLKDDGGQHNGKWQQEGDYVFWPVQDGR